LARVTAQRFCQATPEASRMSESAVRMAERQETLATPMRAFGDWSASPPWRPIALVIRFTSKTSERIVGDLAVGSAGSRGVSATARASRAVKPTRG
jgi:hypothetical protein